MPTKKQIANLHAQVTADVKQYVNEMMRVGKVTKSTTDTVGAGMRRAAGYTDNLSVAQQRGSKSASRFGTVMQQSGYQVQDFAVQVAGGQSALVAFSQQGSQLLGVFGPAGAIAGAALGVGVLITQLIGAGSAAEESTEKVLGLAEATKRFREARANSQFGALNSYEQVGDLRGQIAGKQQEVADLMAFTSSEGMRRRREALARERADPGLLSTDARAIEIDAEIARMGSNLGETAENAAANIKVLQTEILGLKDKMTSLGQTHAEDMLERFFGEVERMAESKAWEEMHRQLLLQERGLDLVGMSLSYYGDEMDEASRRVFTTGKDIGLAIEAVRTFDATLRESDGWAVFSEQFKTEGQIDSMLGQFFGGLDTQSKGNFDHIKVKATEFQREMALMWTDVSDRAGQSFADIVLTGENAFSQLADIIARSMLEIAARMAIINPLLNFLPGVNMAGWWNFDAPAAGGGFRSGQKPYLVGENGPEIFNPGQSGTITTASDTARALSGGSGGMTVYIDAKGADQAAIGRLWSAFQQLNASVESRAVGAVMDRRLRGGHFSGV